jgi:acyl dehydratase
MSLDQIPTTTFGPFTLEHLKAYADASGDFNAIHTDEKAALAAGLPGIIAHGMFSSALLGDRAVEFVQSLGEPQWKISGFQTRFKGMVFLGDTLELSGRVKRSNDQSIQLDLSAKNQKGEIVSTAVAEFTRNNTSS